MKKTGKVLRLDGGRGLEYGRYSSSRRSRRFVFKQKKVDVGLPILPFSEHFKSAGEEELISDK